MNENDSGTLARDRSDGIPHMSTQLAVAFVAGLFGLIPLMVQIASTRAQRRDRMTRLNHLRAELEFLEQLDTLQGKVNARDEAAMDLRRFRGLFQTENSARKGEQCHEQTLPTHRSFAEKLSGWLGPPTRSIPSPGSLARSVSQMAPLGTE